LTIRARALNSAGEPATCWTDRETATAALLEGLLRLPLPRLNLTAYRALVGQLPPPNHDQVEAFVTYVNLVEPERVRQRTEMVVAIQAVIALVYGKAV